jgi:hypothetical protein
MSKAFILQFEEPLHAEISGTPSCGTQTATKTFTEAQDPDSTSSQSNVLPKSAVESGTLTKTAVRMEDTDSDYDFAGAGAIPRTARPRAGTQTHTFINAEGGDQDRDISTVRFLP